VNVRENPSPRRRFGAPRALALLAAAAFLPALVVGCVPQAQAPLAASDAAATVQRTAEIIYHRMAIGYLETGAYTTNVLVDVQLPEGARWTLADYPQDGSSYALVLTSDQVPGVAWRVTPSGVRRVGTN
jgi:hypothetical protein